MKRLLPFALIAVCTLALLGATEALLRLAGYNGPRAYQPDRELGWSPRPAPDVNPAGLRDRAYPLDKADGVYRIALLGDGYSEAPELPVQLTYWRQLPGALAACAFQPGKRVEVLNFAVSGYGSAQQAVMLESRAMRYAPDLVLLQFSADDVQENSFALAQEKSRPFFMLEPGGRLRLDETFAAAPGFQRSLSLPSQVWQATGARSRVLQMSLVREAQATTPLGLAAPPDALWEEAWRVTEGAIARMHDFAARNGARFAVVTAPGAPDLSYAERRIAELAQRRGIVAVALQSLQRDPVGHAEAADRIARRLCAAGS